MCLFVLCEPFPSAFPNCLMNNHFICKCHKALIFSMRSRKIGMLDNDMIWNMIYCMMLKRHSEQNNTQTAYLRLKESASLQPDTSPEKLMSVWMCIPYDTNTQKLWETATDINNIPQQWQNIRAVNCLITNNRIQKKRGSHNICLCFVFTV